MTWAKWDKAQSMSASIIRQVQPSWVEALFRIKQEHSMLWYISQVVAGCKIVQLQQRALFTRLHRLIQACFIKGKTVMALSWRVFPFLIPHSQFLILYSQNLSWKNNWKSDFKFLIVLPYICQINLHGKIIETIKFAFDFSGYCLISSQITLFLKQMTVNGPQVGCVAWYQTQINWLAMLFVDMGSCVVAWLCWSSAGVHGTHFAVPAEAGLCWIRQWLCRWRIKSIFW